MVSVKCGGKCGQDGVVAHTQICGGMPPSCSKKGPLLCPLRRRGPVSPSTVPKKQTDVVHAWHGLRGVLPARHK